MALGRRQTDVLMAVGMQWMGYKPMAEYTQYLSDDMDTRALYTSQRKKTKRQWTGIRPTTADTRHADFSPKAETNLYLKRAWQMGNSLIPTSTQWTDFGLMAVLQWMAMPRVIAER